MFRTKSFHFTAELVKQSLEERGHEFRCEHARSLKALISEERFHGEPGKNLSAQDFNRSIFGGKFITKK